MKREIYRKEGLERLSSPEQLDLLMPTTDRRGWIALAGIGLLLLIGCLWGFLGSVVTTVEGTGLLMREDAIDTILAPHAGRVAEVLVHEDQFVAEGDLLLRLSALNGAAPGVTDVTSPRAGRVLVVAAQGAVMEESSPLAAVEDPTQPLQAVIYVPATDAFKVMPGMRTKVQPSSSEGGDEGVLVGTIERAARFPAGRDDMMFRLQNESWVESVSAMGPVLEMVVDIVPREDAERFYSGTPCHAAITVDERRPVEFLLTIEP
jgi:multidrug efflux pump subunit AcrA (membrane-fusion protein)